MGEVVLFADQATGFAGDDNFDFPIGVTAPELIANGKGGIVLRFNSKNELDLTWSKSGRLPGIVDCVKEQPIR